MTSTASDPRRLHLVALRNVESHYTGASGGHRVLNVEKNATRHETAISATRASGVLLVRE